MIDLVIVVCVGNHILLQTAYTGSCVTVATSGMRLPPIVLVLTKKPPAKIRTLGSVGFVNHQRIDTQISLSLCDTQTCHDLVCSQVSKGMGNSCRCNMH